LAGNIGWERGKKEGTLAPLTVAHFLKDKVKITKKQEGNQRRTEKNACDTSICKRKYKNINVEGLPQKLSE
jgi:hypothetical protein